MEIELITTKKQYREYLEEAKKLTLKDPPLNTPAGKKLSLLTLVIKDYEKKHFAPARKPTPIESIKFRMEQQGLRQVDLVPYIGSSGRVSEVLSGKRSLTLGMIKRLSRGLGIPADFLLSEEDEETKAA